MQKQYSETLKRCTVFSGRSTVPVLRPSSCSHTPSCRYTQSDSQGAARGDAACSASLLWPLVRHTDRVSREGTAIGRVRPYVSTRSFEPSDLWLLASPAMGHVPPRLPAIFFAPLCSYKSIKAISRVKCVQILRTTVIKISVFFILLTK